MLVFCFVSNGAVIWGGLFLRGLEGVHLKVYEED